jgi:hypothetical protein
MIKTVALRLLYLIFDRFLHRLMLLGRPSSSKDVELLVPVMRSRSFAEPTPGLGWTGRTERRAATDPGTARQLGRPIRKGSVTSSSVKQRP